MSKINVKVTHLEDYVPHTGVPDTGFFTHSSVSDSNSFNSYDSEMFYAGISVVMVAVFVILAMAILVKKSVFKKKSGMSLATRRKIFFRLFISMLVFFGMTFSLLTAIKNNTFDTLAAHGPENLTVTSEDVEIEVEIGNEPVLMYVPATVTVRESTDAGYELSVYSSGALCINGTEHCTITQSTGSSLQDNSWGLSIIEPIEGNTVSWKGVPASSSNAVKISAPDIETLAESQTTVYYGVYITPDLPDGEYSGTLNYVAVSNPMPSINQLTYMQDFKNLDEEEKEAVASSMRSGVSYNLVDNRDNKTYKVAKLPDGKIWMVENLDLGRTYIPTDLTSSNTNLIVPISEYSVNHWLRTSGDTSYVYAEFIPVSASNSGDGLGVDTDLNMSYGTLYNYCAVSVGTICTEEDTTEPEYDICPAGWRIPTGNEGTGDYETLVSSFSSNIFSSIRSTVASGGAQFTVSGIFNESVLSDQGAKGAYWSSTSSNNSSRYILEVDKNNSTVTASGSLDRIYGASVRCVVK